VYAIVAALLILFVIGRDRWFFGDEWSFLAQRNGGDLGDLFRSHGEHWTTIPVIAYRVLWNAFGLRTYMPYQAVVVVAHVATAFLLRVVMRRAGVGSWTATIVAAGFLLFGPGQENILWAFQISFVGAIMFGLVQLILSDHVGPIDRRDVMGLVAGAAGLMCSGVALPMIAAVGLAAIARRGWKPAAFHVLPLAGMYALWNVITSPEGIPNPYGRSPHPDEILTFVWSGVRGVFVAIGGFALIGFVIVAVVVAGTVLAWGADRPRRRMIAPGALVVGGLIFLVGTSITRWYVTSAADSQSRYIYTLTALLLPALAVAVDALIRRWRVLAVLIFGVLLVAGVKNATAFGGAPFDSAFYQQQKQLVLSLPRSGMAAQVPGYVRPFYPWFSIGWLRGAVADGDVPSSGSASPVLERHVQFLLSIAQLDDHPPDADCGTYPKGVVLRPQKGDRFGVGFGSPPTANASYFVQDSVVASSIDESGRAVDTNRFKTDFGRTLEIEADGMTLRLSAADPHQELVVCTGRS
jgi:hypothetical protein